MTHLQSSHERKGQAKVQFVRFEATPVKLKLDRLTLIFLPRRGNRTLNHQLSLRGFSRGKIGSKIGWKIGSPTSLKVIGSYCNYV